MKNELTPFDRRIKDKLKNHAVPFEESHWEQMAQQLQQDVDPVGGDALILSRMADWEVPYEENSWALMQERLEHEDAISSEFDRKAAERMHRMEAPYEGANWELMSQKIDEAFSFRHWLHRYHVPELVLMILFAFTLFQYLYLGFLPERFAKQPAIPQVHEKAPVVQKADRPAIAIRTPQPVFPEVFTTTLSNQITLLKSREDLRPAAPSEVMPVKTALAANNVQSIRQPLFSLPLFFYFSEGARIPALEPYAKGSALAGIAAFKHLLKKPTKWYAGVYAGADYNAVNAPTDEVFDTHGYWTDSTGYRAGAFIDMQRKKWGFQTGLTYAKVAYRPNVPVQQYGTFDHLVVESFDQIRYQFVQIPLQVRRGFLPEQSKWDVYLLGGIEANLIVDATYDIKKTEIFSSRASAAMEDVDDKSKLNQKSFPQGILNGDRFIHNAYLSFSAGLGVERSFSSRYFFFAEPIYARPFIGHEIGPNNDRIHQFTLRMGVKMQLR
ncbi:MAG: hypothetical protein IPL49_00710 [Saprospirales bacterium]|nr:hypothetical protein [Saprospirales bacterium]MBK8489439.1 hypothetical protein [Saprospirales bacterium]